ncbi:MAG: prenyltransferase [Anaerolineales bacterium]|nr:prenyltransferase [Anaerolineales bacterium]
MNRLPALLKLGGPLFLFLAVMTYLYGSVVAVYLGFSWNAAAFWLGLGWAAFVCIGMSLLVEVFRSFDEPLIPGETQSERLFTRNRLLMAALIALVAASFITIYFQGAKLLTTVGLVLVGAGILLVLAYAVPPVRLAATGFGELTLAVLLAFIIPSIGFLLQAKEYHRILTLIGFPLMILGFLFFIVLSFPTYAGDLKYGRTTLLMRLGWERAIFLHHSLMVGVYFLFLAVAFLGIPLRILWPVFMGLPFAVLQGWWLQNIARGAPPVWKLLVTNAIALFGLTIYLLIMTFLLH